jgi:6-phosphogluconolactonase
MNAPSEFLVFFGTYGDSVHVSRFSASTGKLSSPVAYPAGRNPSFIALHPKLPVLYAINEQDESTVASFVFDPKTGALQTGSSVTFPGNGPCYVSIDKTGKAALVANYGSGNVAVLPVRPKGGLGTQLQSHQHKGKSINLNRQTGPHAHSFATDPSGKFALCCDLGLDKVFVYPLDAANATLGTPKEVNLKPGAGPRHFAFAPSSKGGSKGDARFVYVINELDLTVTAFAWEASTGAMPTMSELQTITTLPGKATSADSCADIHVHPNGNFLYGSNRGHDSIAIFQINKTTGILTALGHASTKGHIPRNFAIDPTGNFLLAANQESNNVVVFKIDTKTGALTATGEEITVPKPVCIAFKK